MKVKKFYRDGKAEFISVTPEESRLNLGEIIQVEDTLYRIVRKYYFGEGVKYFGMETKRIY